MAEDSTIMLDKKVIEKLKAAKEYPRQTYNELLDTARFFITLKKQKERYYDSFLFEIQKKKMRELWDNEYDEVWEKV